eukprot:Clim_evm3s28 gene=Clim_evmTU3s28
MGLITRLQTSGLARAGTQRTAMQFFRAAATQSQHDIYNKPFFEKNEKLGRPMSPHLTIYSPQVTSMLSITHRLSGAGMAVACSAMALGLPFSDHNLAYYIAELGGSMGAGSAFALKATLAAPFMYHSFNGMRHMWWDSGHGVNLPGVYSSGYLVLGITAVTTIAAAML